MFQDIIDAFTQSPRTVLADTAGLLSIMLMLGIALSFA